MHMLVCGTATSGSIPQMLRPRPEADLSVPRRAHLPRGGPIRPEAGLSMPRRAYPSRGGLIHPEAGLSVPRRTCPSRGGRGSRTSLSVENDVLDWGLFGLYDRGRGRDGSRTGGGSRARPASYPRGLRWVLVEGLGFRV